MLVTPAELAKWLNRYQGGCRICSVVMLTKSPNPYLQDGESTIDHLSERVVFVGANYQQMVQNVWNKQIEADADGFVPAFQAEALWKGKGIHLNRYLAQHVETQALYLCLYYAAVKGEGVEWVEKSLSQEAWLDRRTGLEVSPDWADLAQYLPPKHQPSIKQGCREGVDVEATVNGDGIIIPGGLIDKEVRCRMPHLENVLQIRSFDLKQRGRFEVIQVRRSPYQVSV